MDNTKFRDWELIEVDSGKRNKDGKILSKYKCKKCGEIMFKTRYQFERYNSICKQCMDNYYHKDILGTVYGRLTLVSYAYCSTRRKHYYTCRCSCNNKIVDHPISLNHLMRGDTISCGCYAIEVAISSNTIHGLTNHPLYLKYNGMCNRCYDPTNDRYDNYNGRGIYICERWMEPDYQGLKNFVEDMEESYNAHVKIYGKEDTTIDRIDNDGPYCLANCKWSTRLEQANNKTTSRYVNLYGYDYTIAQISRMYNIYDKIIYDRISRGFSIYDILREYSNEYIYNYGVRVNPISISPVTFG